METADAPQPWPPPPEPEARADDESTRLAEPPPPSSLATLVTRVIAFARWKREHTRERRDESVHAAKRARLDEVLDELPQVDEKELHSSTLGAKLAKAALVLGDAHLAQPWPVAEWARSNRTAERTTALFSEADGATLSWPSEPLRVATRRQAAARPPPSFFDALRLRVGLSGTRRLMTVELPPTVRSVSSLKQAAAEAMALEEGAVEAVVRLPDVLVAADEDVLWLHDGAELRLLLRGESVQQSRDASALQLASSSGFTSLPLPRLFDEQVEDVHPAVAVVAMPGDGGGWTADLRAAWLESFLSCGWGAWIQLEAALGVHADEVHAYSLGWLRAVLSILLQENGCRLPQIVVGLPRAVLNAGVQWLLLVAAQAPLSASSPTSLPLHLPSSALVSSSFHLRSHSLSSSSPPSPFLLHIILLLLPALPSPPPTRPQAQCLDVSVATASFREEVVAIGNNVPLHFEPEGKPGGRSSKNAIGWDWVRRLLLLRLVREANDAPELREQAPPLPAEIGFPRGEIEWSGFLSRHDDDCLLTAACKYGLGAIAPVQRDKALRLSRPEVWARRGCADVLRRRQSLLAEILLYAPWAEASLLKAAARAQTSAALLRRDRAASFAAAHDAPLAPHAAPLLSYRPPLSSAAFSRPPSSHVSLRVRRAAGAEHFVSVRVHRHDLTPDALTPLLCARFKLEESLVGGLLKLPDVLLADAEDMSELCDGTEIELLPAELAS